jgi:hypothetical protein
VEQEKVNGRDAWPKPRDKRMSVEFEEALAQAADNLPLAEEEIPVVLAIRVGLRKPSAHRDQLLPYLREMGVRELPRPTPNVRAFLLGLRAFLRMAKKVFDKNWHLPEWLKQQGLLDQARGGGFLVMSCFGPSGCFTVRNFKSSNGDMIV